ncbi:MAG: COQ9 family protein [Proteobacteria bacterium]|nr:COQ9 family protein [Pseudomonadota bacterium]
MSPDDDRAPDPDQTAALEALLPLVPLHGWTTRALAEALKEAGGDPSEAEWRFPGGAPEMIESFFALSLQRAIANAEPDIAGEMRLGKRVRALVAALLRELGHHKEAVRRAVPWLMLPRNTALGARLMARLVDGIWHAAGDQSADFSWYTKRASLAGIMLPTLLFWLNDLDFDHEPTLAFFDRRLDGLARIGRSRARAKAFCAGLMGPRSGSHGRAAA